MESNAQRVTTNDIEDRIRGVLSAHGRLGRNPLDLPDDADLYAVGLSSLASVNVMLALESEFDLEFPDQMLNRAAFESIAAIAATIRGLNAG